MLNARSITRSVPTLHWRLSKESQSVGSSAEVNNRSPCDVDTLVLANSQHHEECVTSGQSPHRCEADVWIVMFQPEDFDIGEALICHYQRVCGSAVLAPGECLAVEEANRGSMIHRQCNGSHSTASCQGKPGKLVLVAAQIAG